MADVNLEDLLNNRAKTQASVVPEVVPQQEIAAVTQKVENLTPAERQQVDKIKDSIDLVDNNAVVQYGNAAQKNIADFSNGILSNVRGRDLEPAKELLGDLAVKVKGFENEGKGSFLSNMPILGSLFKKKDEIQTSFTTVSAQIDKIQAGLDNQRMVLLKDIAMFDGLYDKNLEYFKQLQLYIQAGEEKLTELRQQTLPKLQAQAQVSDNPMAAQVVKDYEEAINRFEKKIHDLKLSKMIAIQTAPQIRIIQNNDKILVDRIQSAIYNTIPLWKNQMVLALGLSRQNEALQVQHAVSEATNDLLKKNAAMLKQNAHDTAVENERSIVDIETVKQVNDDLIATIEDTLRIQQEGRQKRQAAEAELVQIEEKLKQAIKSAADRSGQRQ